MTQRILFALGLAAILYSVWPRMNASLDMFNAAPAQLNDAELEAEIHAAHARVIEPGTPYDIAAKASAEMSALIKQRSALRVAQMERERGLRK